MDKITRRTALASLALSGVSAKSQGLALPNAGPIEFIPFYSTSLYESYHSTFIRAKSSTPEGAIFIIDNLDGKLDFFLNTSEAPEITFDDPKKYQGAADDIVRSMRYKPFNYLRGVGDKLDDDRGGLDFIPSARHADIIAGTSNWDASHDLNKAMSDIGGRPINLTAVGQFAIGNPLKPPRGTSLFSERTFDNSTGRGTKFFLLPAANCPIYQTPGAIGAGVHNFMRLSGLIFDGNSTNQTKSCALGLVQFIDEYIGTQLENCLFENSYGPNLSLSGDVYAKNIWCARSYLPENTEADYALRINPGLTGDRRLGVMNFDNIFVELAHNTSGEDPKTNKSARAKGMHLNRVVALASTRIHAEAVIYGISIESCQSISITQVTGAWIGNDQEDSALISLIDDSTDFVALGGGQAFGGEAPRYRAVCPIRKRKNLRSRFFPDLYPAPSGPSFLPYVATNSNQSGMMLQPELTTLNALNVAATGADGDAELRLISSIGEDGASSKRGAAFRSNQLDGRLDIGTNFYGSDHEWKTHIRLSESKEGNYAISLFAPLKLAELKNHLNWGSGEIYLIKNYNDASALAVRLNEQNYFIPVWVSGGGTPLKSLVPTHPVTFYFDINEATLWVSTGSSSSDWIKLGSSPML